MKQIGIFEAKTKFTSICEEVARTGQSIVVSKRGAPLVLVTPVPVASEGQRTDILTGWRLWSERNQEDEAEFPEVWKLRTMSKNPLAE